jgi:hypothetical protein
VQNRLTGDNDMSNGHQKMIPSLGRQGCPSG